MALPRYDLYGDMEVWKDNIRQSEAGAWMRAKDVQPLLEQFEAMGGVIPNALYPEGEAVGVRSDRGVGTVRPEPRRNQLPDYNPPTIDDAEDGLPDDDAGSGHTRDGEA